MSPKAQRIAIAEACGWKKCNAEAYKSDELWHIKGIGYRLLSSMPDYLNDLNAMHEAEKVLTIEHMQRANYIDNLRIVVGTEGLHSYRAYTAAATQRAEAFLRTLGLWKE